MADRWLLTAPERASFEAPFLFDQAACGLKQALPIGHVGPVHARASPSYS